MSRLISSAVLAVALCSALSTPAFAKGADKKSHKSVTPTKQSAKGAATGDEAIDDDAAADDADEAPLSDEEKDKLIAEILQKHYTEMGFKAGPLKGQNVGIYGVVDVPEGFAIGDRTATGKFLEETGNIVNGSEQATLVNLKSGYFILFQYDDVGYVSDSDKDDLDADAMLKSITDGTEEQNITLRAKKQPTLTVTGWHTKPHYDEATHNLEWAPALRDSDGQDVVNYNVKLLGRRGVMEVDLVAAPDQIAGALPDLRGVISKYTFKQGEDYASFTSGDKVAEYGLTGLVAGGAVAVAAKSGLLGKLIKIIWVPIAAGLGFLKRLFGGGNKNNQG